VERPEWTRDKQGRSRLQADFTVPAATMLAAFLASDAVNDAPVISYRAGPNPFAEHAASGVAARQPEVETEAEQGAAESGAAEAEAANPRDSANDVAAHIPTDGAGDDASAAEAEASGDSVQPELSAASEPGARAAPPESAEEPPGDAKGGDGKTGEKLPQAGADGNGAGAGAGEGEGQQQGGADGKGAPAEVTAAGAASVDVPTLDLAAVAAAPQQGARDAAHNAGAAAQAGAALCFELVLVYDEENARVAGRLRLRAPRARAPGISPGAGRAPSGAAPEEDLVVSGALARALSEDDVADMLAASGRAAWGSPRGGGGAAEREAAGGGGDTYRRYRVALRGRTLSSHRTLAEARAAQVCAQLAQLLPPASDAAGRGAGRARAAGVAPWQERVGAVRALGEMAGARGSRAALGGLARVVACDESPAVAAEAARAAMSLAAWLPRDDGGRAEVATLENVAEGAEEAEAAAAAAETAEEAEAVGDVAAAGAEANGQDSGEADGSAEGGDGGRVQLVREEGTRRVQLVREGGGCDGTRGTHPCRYRACAPRRAARHPLPRPLRAPPPRSARLRHVRLVRGEGRGVSD